MWQLYFGLVLLGLFLLGLFLCCGLLHDFGWSSGSLLGGEDVTKDPADAEALDEKGK
jgi:hypothetical protein